MSAGKAWLQDRETTGGAVFTVREQRDACWDSAGSLLLTQSGPPDHRMVLPKFKLSVSCSVKPFWKHP